jgi:quercetin dioxygenase-like cupin family protein
MEQSEHPRARQEIDMFQQPQNQHIKEIAMKARWPLAGALALAGSAAFAGNVSATTPVPGVTTTILARSTVGELNIKARTNPANTWSALLKTRGASDADVVDNKFAAGSDTGWHSHPGPSLVFVIIGTVTNYTRDDPTCSPHVYTAGSNFVDAGGADSHLLRNEGNAPAETLAVQLLPTGSTRRVDEPVPASCV